jgi:hypothetical protein
LLLSGRFLLLWLLLRRWRRPLLLGRWWLREPGLWLLLRRWRRPLLLGRWWLCEPGLWLLLRRLCGP